MQVSQSVIDNFKLIHVLLGGFDHISHHFCGIGQLVLILNEVIQTFFTKYNMSKSPYAPFTLQALCPTVIGLFLGGGTTSQVAPFHPSCLHYRQSNSRSRHVAHLSFNLEMCMRPCVTVAKHPRTSTGLRSLYYFHWS